VTMWPFRKKTREDELNEIKKKTFDLVRTIRETGNYDPALVRGVLAIINQIDRLEKQWKEETEFNARYSYKPR
jgi:hypothetical protein